MILGALAGLATSFVDAKTAKQKAKDGVQRRLDHMQEIIEESKDDEPRSL